MQGVVKPSRPVGAHHRLLSCISTGSQSSSDVHAEEALCLSELLHDFFQDNEMEGRSLENDLDSKRVDWVSGCDDLMMEGTLSLWRVVENNVDTLQLLSHVAEAVEMFSFLRRNVSGFWRNVVAFLSEKGHNAAICSTKWDCSSDGGVIAWNHEFIHVERGGRPLGTNPVQGIPVAAVGEAIIHGANCRAVGFCEVVSEARPDAPDNYHFLYQNNLA